MNARAAGRVGQRPDRRLDHLLRDLRRTAQWHRRLIAAALLGGSAAFGLHALAPPPPPSVAVLVAARDIAPGAQVTPADVQVVRREVALVPDGALHSAGQALGRATVAPLRRGELLTDVRLLGAGLLDRLGPGQVATPVRVGDPQAAALLRPGDVVDVLAAGAAGTQDSASMAVQARLVAAAVRVLAVPAPSGDATFSAPEPGALVVLATTELTAARLVGAAATERLSVVFRRSE